MLQQTTFPIIIGQQSMRITSMLQQDFDNQRKATINADNFNVNAEGFRNGDYRYYGDSATINANNFNVTADGFSNRATISADNFNVTAGGDFYNSYSTINANNFNVTAEYSFIISIVQQLVQITSMLLQKADFTR